MRQKGGLERVKANNEKKTKEIYTKKREEKPLLEIDAVRDQKGKPN